MSGLRERSESRERSPENCVTPSPPVPVSFRGSRTTGKARILAKTGAYSARRKAKTSGYSSRLIMSEITGSTGRGETGTGRGRVSRRAKASGAGRPLAIRAARAARNFRSRFRFRSFIRSPVRSWEPRGSREDRIGRAIDRLPARSMSDREKPEFLPK